MTVGAPSKAVTSYFCSCMRLSLCFGRLRSQLDSNWPGTEIRRLHIAFRSTPRHNNDEKSLQMPMADEDMKILQNLMHAYAATFGSPTCCFTRELLADFPQLSSFSMYARQMRDGTSSIGLDFESGTRRARIYHFLTFSIGWMHPHHRLCDLMAEYWRDRYGDISLKMHSAHNRRMKELVLKEKLLVYDVKEGWGPLCDFLDVLVPDVPFPRVNDSKQMQRNYLFLQVYGAAMWVLYGGALAIAILLLSQWK
jgi:hypothetical protein